MKGTPRTILTHQLTNKRQSLWVILLAIWQGLNISGCMIIFAEQMPCGIFLYGFPAFALSPTEVEQFVGQENMSRVVKKRECVTIWSYKVCEARSKPVLSWIIEILKYLSPSEIWRGYISSWYLHYQQKFKLMEQYHWIQHWSKKKISIWSAIISHTSPLIPQPLCRGCLLRAILQMNKLH